jgi:hypothetical protein
LFFPPHFLQQEATYFGGFIFS